MDNALLERLVILNEECSEVQHIISKILRHGMDSFHPDSPEITNTFLLQEELGDLLYAIGMVISKDLDESLVFTYTVNRPMDIAKYLHFNNIEDLKENAIRELIHYRQYSRGMIATDKTAEQIWSRVLDRAGLKGIELSVLANLKTNFLDYFEEITTEL
jgi:hypothetical protein